VVALRQRSKEIFSAMGIECRGETERVRKRGKE